MAVSVKFNKEEHERHQRQLQQVSKVLQSPGPQWRASTHGIIYVGAMSAHVGKAGRCVLASCAPRLSLKII